MKENKPLTKDHIGQLPVTSGTDFQVLGYNDVRSAYEYVKMRLAYYDDKVMDDVSAQAAIQILREGFPVFTEERLSGNKAEGEHETM